jgi:aspartate aminotransferase-like enzyme
MTITIKDPIRFFLPGPTWVREDVREAMLQPVVGHRSPPFKKLYASLGPRLERVFRTRTDTPVATGSATLVMESAVISGVASDVLNLTCGAFSERWHAISRSLGKTADRVSVPWGRALDPDLVRAALRKKRYDAVTMVHNETSTGVINPLEELSRVVREESDALVLVDTVSSLGGAAIETDAWGLDVVLASVQKALAAPPGVAVFAISERAADRASSISGRGYYTDLLRYRDKHRGGGTITTPAVSILYALDRQLDVVLEEGLEARWARHLVLRDRTLEWAASRGYAQAAEEGAQSPTISCLKPPPGVDAPALVGALAERGIVVGGGYGDWKATTFRIGHMGEVRLEDLEELLSSIDQVSARLA